MFNFFFISLSTSTFYLKETFDTGTSTHWRVPKKLRPFTKLGKWAVSTGDCYGSQQKWLGLTTTQSHRDYLLYTNFNQPMNTTKSDFVLSYTLRMNPFVDCSGQFVKIMDASSDMTNFSQDLPFAIKFGPDVCGPSFKRTHVVIMYNGKEYETNHPIGVIKDPFTHSYSLIIRANNTYAVLIDGEVADESTLEERFDIPYLNKRKVTNLAKSDYQNINIDEEEEEDEELLNQGPIMHKEYNKANVNKEENEKKKEIQNDFDNETIPEADEKVDYPPFGHFESLGYLVIDVHQSCCGSLFDNFVVTDNERESLNLLRDNFLQFRVQEAQMCDRGANGGGSGGDNEDGNDGVFGNKEQMMKQYEHKIDFSNFDPL